MSAIFDGSSYLTTANHLIGATPAYPVLIAGWAKVADVTSFHWLGGVSDNGTGYGAGLDMLAVGSAGDVASDPIQAFSTAAGSANKASKTQMYADSTWRLIGGYWSANNSRQALIGASRGTADTVARAVGTLSIATIGALTYNAGAVHELPWSGRLAEVVFASGFTAGDIDTILTQLAAGTRAIDVAELSGQIGAYQPLRAALNDSGYVGPDWDNTGVTFDAADHPIAYATGAATKHFHRQMMGAA